jgi:hypothetical protein
MKRSRSTINAISGAAIAVAAAGLFMSQTIVPVAAADEAKVHCTGANACKGKSDCATAKNSCKGTNSCKGQGWLDVDEKTCRAKGGVPEKSSAVKF